MASQLTICLLTYNRHTDLKKTLQSIKELNYQNFSLIVGDNSTTNKAENIVKTIFPKATYYRNVPSTNEIENSNKCISMAKTEYVCLMHDDDILQPDYLDVIMQEIQKNDAIDLAYTGRKMIDETDHTIGIQKMKSNKKIVIYNAEDILNFMILGKELNDYKVFINTPGLIFKKSIFEKVKGFDAEINTHCDTNFLLKSLVISNKVLFINDTLFINKIWYGLSGRTKSSENGEVLMAEKEVLDNFLQFCKKNNLSKYPKQQIYIYKKFSLDAIAINGPLGWIALRFKGDYFQRMRTLIKTASQIIQLNNHILLFPKFYIVLLGSILVPQSILKQIHKMIISYYITKQ